MAKAIAEGKVKLSVADLDRLIRLEGFLREEEKVEGTKIILEWRDYDGDRLREATEEEGPTADEAQSDFDGAADSSATYY